MGMNLFGRCHESNPQIDLLVEEIETLKRKVETLTKATDRLSIESEMLFWNPPDHPRRSVKTIVYEILHYLDVRPVFTPEVRTPSSCKLEPIQPAAPPSPSST